LGFRVLGFFCSLDPAGAAPWAGCGSDNMERPCTYVQFLVVESSVNVGECGGCVRVLSSLGVRVASHGSRVAYSIALESSVAAFTLWDRPCYQ
jgi:hypothetical protein